MGCFVYILKSKNNGTLYVGSSENPIKRLEHHNLGKAKYTSRNVPYELVFTQEFESTSQARSIELRLKSWKRKDFLEKIIHDGEIKIAE